MDKVHEDEPEWENGMSVDTMGEFWGTCVQETQRIVDGLTPFYRVPGGPSNPWNNDWDWEQPQITIRNNSNKEWEPDV